MNQYETIFLMKDDITEEQRNEIINKIVNYLNTNGSDSKKKLVELPPLNTSPHKKQGSKEPTLSHGSRSNRKNPTYKNYNGKKVMVLKINL